MLRSSSPESGCFPFGDRSFTAIDPQRSIDPQRLSGTSSPQVDGFFADHRYLERPPSFTYPGSPAAGWWSPHDLRDGEVLTPLAADYQP